MASMQILEKKANQGLFEFKTHSDEDILYIYSEYIYVIRININTKVKYLIPALPLVVRQLY